MLILVILVSLCFFQVQGQENCKRPFVAQRLLADDVRYASPFYVIALPRTPETQEMDNICYTYFEKDNGKGFFHIMSITYKNNTNTYHEFSKEDIETDWSKMGIAEAKSEGMEECVYHDYTLKPICSESVFILYRCFISGKCSSSNIDFGQLSGVDVRVTLAADPKIRPECRTETESALRDTSALAGGNYILLPQSLSPNCITKFKNLTSIGANKALGPKTVSDDLSERFGENPQLLSAPPKPVTSTQVTRVQSNFQPTNNYYGYPNNGVRAPYPTQTYNQGHNSYSHTSSSSYASTNTGNYGAYRPSPTPAQNPAFTWGQNNQQWSPDHRQQIPNNNQLTGKIPPLNPNEVHHHIWIPSETAALMKMVANSSNVIYHVHSWGQNCCKCP